MPVFEYKGLNTQGQAIKGTIDGDNSKIARAKLRRQGVFPTELTEKKKVERTKEPRGFDRFFKRVRLLDVAVMTRQMATLVKANVPIVDALTAIVDQVENDHLKLILTDVKEQVNEGISLATALGKYPQVFSNLYINMVKAGEASGTLDTVLMRLAEFTESSVKLKNKIVGAMTYPVIMMCIGTFIVSGLLVFVIPRITEIFSDMERALPLITRIVLGLSHLLIEKWYIILGLLFLTVYFIRKTLSTEKGRLRFDPLFLKLPIFGKLLRMISVSRFASTLSTLLQGGVPLLTAMDIVKNVVDNRVIRNVLIQARENISEGQSLAAPLRESGEFPAMVTHMISIGEKTGELESMLNTISDAYNNEVDTTVNALTQILEPLMIVIMGVAVGIIVMAILLPILDLNKIAT